MIAVIRLATQDDVLQISEILRHYAPLVATSAESPATQKRLAASTPEAVRGLLLDPKYILLCAQCDNALAGFISVRNCDTIAHFFVLERHQGKRIGSALWHQAKERDTLAGNNVAINVKSSLAAEQIYRHWGFQVQGNQQEGDGVPFVQMQYRFDDAVA